MGGCGNHEIGLDKLEFFSKPELKYILTYYFGNKEKHLQKFIHCRLNTNVPKCPC